MVIEFSRPWYGVAIPSCIIFTLTTVSYFGILQDVLTTNQTIWYFTTAIMISYSYYLAIVTPPTPAPSTLTQSFISDVMNNENDIFPTTTCKKCKKIKLPRAHHCKTCNTCVVMMDHHCPWTMNCVGYTNYPHFIRFLAWVIISTTNLLSQLIKQAYKLYIYRNSPFHLYQNVKYKIIILTLLIPGTIFVWLTVLLLLLKTLQNQIWNGMTQIEYWQFEMIENKYFQSKSSKVALQLQLLENLLNFYNKKLSTDSITKIQKLISSLQNGARWNTSFHSIINFPYDLGLSNNITTTMGSLNPLSWFNPWYTPLTASYNKINEFAIWDDNETHDNIKDMLLCLPWPLNYSNNSTFQDGELVVKSNDYGETLQDFGVDYDD
ncbi:hypothetical protein TBLA_0B00480 [Henningerozyma blattae CBS 6284]|uniref:Palmitoyltransferase n=1 Tax=Henningerozyma blattae (strain ATCC 34711 / CBS 6284 / DSM 70876 / NBRC 10599 / NRRL Y-10934 / UCD 77-7) TaxID=1071380 RepID=I2GXP0_HENB6|nr:hypothetical protein TBLA_0B00480 [Tetrapisispora blattae CBS 6284]CCH58892.1 hypothetical protein TBLA_0B00480 [Tetrapisispora blattae CBS 6284]